MWYTVSYRKTKQTKTNKYDATTQTRRQKRKPQYKGLVCPLDGFELLLFSLAGADGKTYPLCPLCYSHPPFEGALKTAGGAEGAAASLKAGMACTACLHPTCRHAPSRQGVMPCAECEAGTLVLDPVSAPRWRLDCSRCSFLVYLPPSLHDVKVARGAASDCAECGARRLRLEFKKGAAPAALCGGGGSGDGGGGGGGGDGGGDVGGGEGFSYAGCVACDDALAALCDVRHGKTWVRRGGGARRGRGRGRRGRGRGRRGDVDPRMTFDRF